jgi:hypothetical protein
MSPQPAAPGATPVDSGAGSLQWAPPLSGLCALAAWAGMLTNHLLVPALLGSAQRDAALAAERIGDFMINLASIAGLAALSAGLLALLRDGRWLGLQRRLLLAMFAGILVPTLAVATFLERERTTTELVLFALGAAQVLSVMLCTSAARLTRERSARLLTLAMASAALCALAAQLFELFARQSLVAWHEQSRALAARVGEGCYLLGLIASPFFVTPASDGLRDRIARGLGVVVLGLAAIAFHLFSGALSRDYAVTLYNAQHVSLFVDSMPALYAIPIGAALAAATAAVIGSEPARQQAGLGLLLWLGSGFAPRVPDRLLTATLASLLLLRAVAARSVANATPAPAPEPAAPAVSPAPLDS